MRDITLEDTFRHDFSTRAFATGIPTLLAGTPVLSVLEENNATPITAGVTVSVDRASVVGLNEATIVATAANGYEAGKSYSIYISTGTVGGVSVVGEVVGNFTIAASAAAVDLANATDGLSALKTLVDDVPTVSEFNARTLVAASYFDATADAVATVTTLTNLPSIPANWLTAAGLATDAVNEIRDSITGFSGSLDTDAGGRMRVVDGTGVGEIDTLSGTVALRSATQTSIDAIEADTNELQGDWVNGGRLDLLIDAILLDTGTTLDAHLTDIKGTGFVKDTHSLIDIEAFVDLIDDGTSGLAKIATDVAATLVDTSTTLPLSLPAALTKGTADSGTTTTMVDAARTESDADYWKDKWIRFTSGNISGQTRLITGFTPASDTITFVPATTQAVATNTYELIPAAAVDVRLWNGTAMNNVIAGRVDADVGKIQVGVISSGVFAAGAIDAAAIATDAIGAAEIATDAINEIRDAITGFAGSFDLDANGRVRIVDGTGVGELDTSSGLVQLLAATQASIDAIEADTNELQGDWVNGGRLDLLIDAILLDTGTTLDTKLNDIQGATFSSGTDSLEAIRDRGDAAWTTGAGGSDRLLMVDTTIATLASQTSFTLTAGAPDNDAYLNCTIVIEDVSTATQKAIGVVSAYAGGTKTVTLKYDPGVFVMATTDKVYILAENALKSTDQNRQLDVTAAGTTGIDWGNIENKGATVDLSATDTNLVDTVTTLTNLPTIPANWLTASGLATDAVNEIRDSITGFAGSLDTDANGRVRIVDGTGAGELDTSSGLVQLLAATETQIDDIETALGTAGAGLTAQPWNAAWDAEVQSECADALVAHGTTAVPESYAANGVAFTWNQFMYAIHQKLMQRKYNSTASEVYKLNNTTLAFAGTLDDATNPTEDRRV